MIKHCFCNYYTNITNWFLEIYPKQSEFRFCFWLFCSDANTTWAQVTAWGYSEVISERQQLSSLVFEVVDKFGIFSILPCQSFLHTSTHILFIVYLIMFQLAVVFSTLADVHSNLCKNCTFSSNTGVSMVSAPWRLKQLMMVLKTFSLIAICLGL